MRADSTDCLLVGKEHPVRCTSAAPRTKQTNVRNLTPPKRKPCASTVEKQVACPGDRPRGCSHPPALSFTPIPRTLPDMPLCPGALTARPIARGICFALVWLLAHTSLGLGFSDAESYRIRTWKAEDGLPQNSVTSIVQTRDGYLWFGTFNGLTRFDGVQFRVFVPDNTPGLPSNRILALFEDRDGALLIGTEEGFLAKSTKGNFKALTPYDQNRNSSALHTIVQSRDGTYWLLTFDWQLLKWNEGRLTLVSTNWDLQGHDVFGLAMDSTGDVWIGTDRELAVYREGKFVPEWDDSSEKGFSVAGLGRGRHGGCWVVANDRVRRFVDGKWEAEAGALPRSKAIVNGVCET